MLKIYRLIKTLKKKKRQGWIDRGFESDSIAEHIFGAMILGWYLAEQEKADKQKVIEMILVHDLIMMKVKDVTPGSESYQNKRELEEENKNEVGELFPKKLRERYLELFDEFNDRKTLEAVVAREADKLETLNQARVFEEETGRKDILDEFLRSYKDQFSTGTGKRLFQELRGTH